MNKKILIIALFLAILPISTAFSQDNESSSSTSPKPPVGIKREQMRGLNEDIKEKRQDMNQKIRDDRKEMNKDL
jgi:hypothetical protein